VVLAAAGYPESPRLGDAITGLPARSDDLRVFHAGTRRDGDRLLTAGGRVLGVTAHGPDLGAARARAYGAIEKIHFDGMHFRRDIGLRGTKSA
jgi:phosphoribosylamine--glycine ligase